MERYRIKGSITSPLLACRSHGGLVMEKRDMPGLRGYRKLGPTELKVRSAKRQSIWRVCSGADPGSARQLPLLREPAFGGGTSKRH